MTRTDLLTCIHEPFGDAFYYGPERLSERYENDPEAREKSGFADVTYKNVVDKIDEDIVQVCRYSFYPIRLERRRDKKQGLGYPVGRTGTLGC